MYNSQSLLSSHGRFEANMILRLKPTPEQEKAGISGSSFAETGSSQSPNVKNHINQMIEEAVLNAFYKLNNRRGDRIFNKDNYNDDISQYLESYKILSYKIQYYEDRRYSYKRENREGKYKYVTYRDGEEHKIEEPVYLTPKKRKEKQDLIFTETDHYNYEKERTPEGIVWKVKPINKYSK